MSKCLLYNLDYFKGQTQSGHGQVNYLLGLVSIIIQKIGTIKIRSNRIRFVLVLNTTDMQHVHMHRVG